MGNWRNLFRRARFQAERPRSPAEVTLFQSIVTKLVSPPRFALGDYQRAAAKRALCASLKNNPRLLVQRRTAPLPNTC